MRRGAEFVEETRAFNAELGRRLAELPPIWTVPATVTRELRRAGSSIFPAPVLLPHARELRAPGRGGDIALRVLAPEGEPTGVYVHFHGGGWTLGSADGQDPLLFALAQATGLVAVSVEYRLAPEHPYPAGPDDVEDATLWLLGHGADELGAPALFAIGGESAGAHLAVVTLLRLRDRHGVTDSFTAANLVYGGYDLNGTPSRWLWGDRELVLSQHAMRWFERNFVEERSFEERRDPDVSPLYADLHGLPPALFTVGGADPLLDDSLFMHARWLDAGNEAELHIWEEAAHGFNLFPIAVARAANDAQHAFLSQAFSR